MGKKDKHVRGLYKQPGSSNYHYDFTVNDVRYRASTRTDKKKLAEEILAIKRADAMRGELNIENNKKRKKFIDLADRFVAEREPLMPSREYYETTVGTLKAFFGNKPINAITEEQVGNYVKARLDGGIVVGDRERKPVRRTTVNRDLTVLKAMFNFGIRKKMCKHNPVVSGMIDLKAEDQAARLEYLSVEEVREYLGACSPAYYPVALCAVESGMRKGEILGLVWAQVNFHHGTITLKKTKAGKQRVVYMSEQLTAVLRGLKCNSDMPNVFFES